MTGAPTNTLKTRLNAGDVQIGVWLCSASPLIAELSGGAGFDWCLIDWEHGPNDLVSVTAQLQALAISGTPAVVRVPDGADWLIKQVLDAGAQTVMVPMVNTAEDAKRVAAAMRYAPEGHRGMGGALARATSFSRRSDYVSTTNDQVFCMVQVETAEAMSNLAEITATPGVDGVFIGPADLSADMGYPGQPRHPEVMAEIERGLGLIREMGKTAGIVGFAADENALYRKWGANFLGIGADMTALVSAFEGLKQANAS